MGGGDLKGGGGGKEGKGGEVDEANVFRELEGTSVDCHQGTGQLSVKKNRTKTYFLDRVLYLFPGSCSCLFCTKGLMFTRTALSLCFAQKMFFSENVHF